ncbi:hypothetical protein J2J97_32005 (plasmid) [Rhizobium bangladeshense]|uniref:hypothetical protein n=1 Tax=Rhizobium bangladeshense TaxID=1138189 RepID=UPI001A97E42E|nr:hypothetical protein [Rhizobium bangladeshense]QSY98697.1 hypothetical protein J2J97_32005 [Rhizobium bangladeshense]
MSLYPNYIPPHPKHPSSFDFQVVDAGEIGKALLTLRPWRRGDFMARFDGVTVPTVYQHTLQKTPSVHLLDVHFIGMLAHACDPNIMLDMEQQEMYALKDIAEGSILSMDYAATEDHLFQTFACGCGAPNCRGWITGRKQAVPAPFQCLAPVV